MRSAVTAVVPTLGWSPLLADAVAALRSDGGGETEIVVVWQGEGPPPALAADRVLAPGRNLGFAAATNLGAAAGRGELVATVNDDALIQPGWTEELAAALADEPTAGAAQGVNLRPGIPPVVDGYGLGWNRWWQAVQLGSGGPLPALPGRAEVFGVSATAALYRRRALEAVALPGGGFFDPRLGSYYEDVELACRLRAAGFGAVCASAARAEHRGSASGLRLGRRRLAWIYGNRHLVLARLLGRRYPLTLHRSLARDLLDAGSALAGRDLQRLAGIAGGWARAARRLPSFAHCGAPALARSELARFRVSFRE